MHLQRMLVVVALVIVQTARASGKDTPAATAGTAAEMAQAAKAFLESLDDAQRDRATLPFDDPRRLDWHNIPKPDRKGVQLRDLSDEQRERGLALVQAALSDEGMEKARRILALENNLREGEKGLANGHLRDPLRYFFTIFGEPGARGSWGWSFEGHHLSLNFVVRDGAVVSDTPSFWGANPATVKQFVDGGPAAGVRTLADEEQLAFDLLGSLDDEQRAAAIVAAEAPKDYRGPGEPQPPKSSPVGLPAARMSQDQQETLRKLLAEYSGHLAPELAVVRLREIEDAGVDAIHFAWGGADRPGVGHAYRIQGPTFVLELVNVQSDPAGNVANHIHSVWRSLRGDFGVEAK